MFKPLITSAALAAAVLAGPVSAASILTDIAQTGTDQTYNYFNPRNTAFNAIMDADHTVTQVGDYTSASSFSGMDAVWVNAHHNSSGVFQATEATNIRNFVESGKKAVIITDNTGWSNYNAHIESIIGATITDTCDTSTGTASATNPLGAGVGSVYHACGSVLDPAANAEVIVSSGIASLYTVGAGEVLVITSVDLFRNASMAEPEFAQNISNWMGTPLSPAPVPLPAGVPLLLTGIGAFAMARRAGRKAA